MPRSRIALETGMHSPWVSRVLSELGHEVIVAHARNVRLIGERKDDRLDAQTLARLVRIDPQLLCPVKHRSAKAQADLTVIRARAGLVRARTALVNTARGLAKSYGERLRGCNVRNMNPEKAEGLSPELQTALEPLLTEGDQVPLFLMRPQCQGIEGCGSNVNRIWRNTSFGIVEVGDEIAVYIRRIRSPSQVFGRGISRIYRYGADSPKLSVIRGIHEFEAESAGGHIGSLSGNRIRRR
jgi:Transposase